MMPSRSTPNLQTTRETTKNHTPSIYSYLQNQSGLNFAPVTSPTRDDESPPPAPPVRDSSSLKSIKYGPGHEKFPSWPVPAAAETPQILKGPPSGGSHRSKSWTDHTNYPKEKVVTYTRPYMKRQHSSMQQKLKTVMEKCEKITPETYESRLENRKEHLYLPHVDREGKPLGDMEYMVPSPPERDNNKTQLTQADLEKYVRAYEDPTIEKLCQYNDNIKGSLSHLTQAELEQYTRNYEESLNHQHQKQPSYAQSEGYHSYVSSTDSSSTPFLDRLRRDSEAAANRSQSFTWEEINEQENNVTRWEGRDSVVTNSSGSASSSETLKWHGSMSDVSVASSSCTHLANSPSSSVSRQLIVHSARVQTPQKHHSESVLYIGSDIQNGWKDQEKRNNNTNKLKLFAVNTYTMEPSERQQEQNERLTSLASQQSLSVADRINELEKQRKYSYLAPDKKHRIPDPTLKAIQKRALLSFYERHHPNTTKSNAWRSEPQLARSQPAHVTVPQPPPRIKMQSPSRRASSASDYASGTNSRRSSFSSRDSRSTENKLAPRHQHSNSCGSLSADLLGPVIVGPSISVDDWIPERPPERPPKNPHLRNAFPDLFQTQRLPSPDLPPPSPPPVLEDEVFNNDEPLPPPPPELRSADWNDQASDRLLDTGSRQFAEPQVETSKNKESSKLHSPNKVPEQLLNFPNQRGYSERSSTRYPAVQKVQLNGNIAISQKVTNTVLQQYRAEPLRPVQKCEEFKKLDSRSGQRASIAESFSRDIPPPLQPRQMRINQSMRARIPDKRSNELNRISPPRSEKIKEMGSRPLTYTMSHSKASYLASRRERERIVPDSDTGVYKRTMSPNGHALTSETISESPKVISRDTKWPTSLLNKETVLQNNNTNLIRRVSMNEKSNKSNTILSLHSESKDDYKKNQVVLPDVLPVKEKILPYRSQYPIRPPQLNCENGVHQKLSSPPKYESPPSSPCKSPSRNSPFTPLRSTLLSSPLKPTVIEDPTRISSSISPATTAPCETMSPIKLSSPVRTSPMISTSTNTPLQTSPTLTPPSSPKVYFTSYPSPPQSPKEKEEHPTVIEGLQMIQRTEVILRVNVCTTDAASQTEKEELPPTPLPTRRKLQEEIECEKLTQDLIKQLPPSDRLKEILLPGPDYKKPTDYVSGLYRPEVTSRPRPVNSPFRSRTSTPNCSPPPSANNSVHSNSSDVLSISKSSDQSSIESSSPLSPTSTYFTTSEPKAKFLTRYSQDMNQFSIVKDTKDLSLKKEELVNRLDRKLEVLRSEQVVVFEECRLNDELGENVDVHMNRLARPHEYSKFCLHVEEVGKITSLLLGLSGRLARAENALMTMADDDPERRILEAKRDKLKDQLEEAKKLKESIDRRSVNVSNILCKYMNSEEYADYDHFINMKAKLIMDSREISDKIKLGEEQLMALKDTLMTAD